MYFHALLHFNNTQEPHWWTNRTFEELLSDLIVPYMNKHIVPVRFVSSKRAMLNLGSGSYLQVFKTSKKIIDGRYETLTSDKFASNDCTMEIANHVRLSKSVKGTRSLLETAFAPSKRQVFVVMAFGDPYLDSAYNGVIRPIIEKFNFNALRIDEIQDSGKISDQILQAIAESEYILCDLSGERPNCYYEAGFAHALGKDLIFTIRKGERVHFDLDGYRFIDWNTESEIRKKLTSRFDSLETKYEESGSSA